MAVKKKPETAEKPVKELEWLRAELTPVVRLAVDGVDPDDDEDLTCDVNFYTGVSVQRMDAWTGEIYMLGFSMEPGACNLTRLQNGAPLLNNHSSYDLSDVVGVVETASIENGIGKATVRFSNRPELAGIRADVKNKIIRNISMGAAINKLKDVTPEKSKMKSYLAVDWEPREISIVPIPADAGAGFLSQQHVEPGIAPNIETRAKTALEETNMDELEVARLAEVARLDAIRTEALKAEAVTAERTRVTAIDAACKPFTALSADFRAELISSGSTVDLARAAIINKLAEVSQADPTRSSNTSITRDQGDTKRLQAENALLNRWQPGTFALDAGREFHGMSLLEMAKDFVAMKGVSVRGMDRNKIVELAFQGTTDFPNVLANVFNKSLRMGYNAEPQTFKPVTKRSTIVDFKPVSRTQIGDVPTLKLIGAQGEFSYAKVTDAKETYQLATYGQIFAINRQTLINDDMGAFTRIPESQGRAAARMESDVVWGIITANAALGVDNVALFHATHNNLIGTGTVISINSLGIMRQKLRVQTGLAGVGYLNLTPKYLVVPAALETVAQQYTVNTNILVNVQSAVNPIGPTLTVIPEPRLDANSATAWYLFTDPGMIDTVEYSYLEGQEGVYMETRMGFDVDGMELKVREDFAAKALDFRGMVKNNGA